jgi:hypothetical protein
VTLQVFPVQLAPPLLGSPQAVHPLAVQPAATLPSATHRAVGPVPQAWNPAAQVTVHMLALQAGVPLGGGTQARHPLAVQPAATLPSATQVLPHR